MNLHKILSETEFEQLFPQDETGISIGSITNFDFEIVDKFFNFWTRRIDKIIELNKKTHGYHTQLSNQFANIRGFTYSEYSALFNSHISSENFVFYPIFNQLGIEKGGINSDKQRADYLQLYSLEQEFYIKALFSNGYGKVLNYFFLERSKAQLPLKHLQMHSYVVAPTGIGKSELLRVLFYELQKEYNDFSFILFDPHGDLAKKVKRFHLNGVNQERVIYIDPFMKDGFTPTFNMFDMGDKSAKNLDYTVSLIINAFSEILTREGGEFTELMVNMLEKAIYFLLSRNSTSLDDLINLLKLSPDILLEAKNYDDYFGEKFCKIDARSREPLLNRIERLRNSPVLKSIFSGQSSFNLENAINSNKILIFNLGELSDMSQEAFGKFLLATIRSLARKRNPENLPTHTFFFIDECQNFVSGSYEKILTEMRKYGLHLVLANQYPNQLGEQLEPTLKNTAIKIVGGDDIKDIETVIPLSKNGSRLQDYEFYLKMRGKESVKMKVPDFLVKDKNYQMTIEEEKQFDEFQLAQYYKPVNASNFFIPNDSKREENNEKQILIKKESESPQPPFGLFLGNDGNTTD